jgi:hypothetical protein
LTASALAQVETEGDTNDDDDCPVPSLKFQSVDASDYLDNKGESFIDDSTLSSTSSLPIESHQVASVDQLLHSKSALENLKLLAHSWERALYTIGGP